MDLEIMLHLASLIKKHFSEELDWDPVGIVEEFTRVIRKEQDFRIEAAHIERFAENFQSDMTIHVPHAYRDFSSRKVLTMEFIGGIKVSEITRAKEHEYGIDPKVVAARDILTLVKQGEAKIKFEHKGLEPMLKTLDQNNNRSVFAIVLASLVIGSALIVLSGVPPKWHEIPVIGIIGAGRTIGTLPLSGILFLNFIYI